MDLLLLALLIVLQTFQYAVFAALIVRCRSFIQYVMRRQVSLGEVILVVGILLFGTFGNSTSLGISQRVMNVVLLAFILTWNITFVRATVPTLLALVGASCNMLALLANGGLMPAIADPYLVAASARHTLITPATHLYWLCDIIPIYLHGLWKGTFSIGDVGIALGGWMIALRVLCAPKAP